MHIGTIAILIIALLVIVAIVMGTDNTIEFFKKVFDLFGSKHKNADICAKYESIKSEQDLIDLVHYVKNGSCGGATPDDAFIFSIDTTPSTKGVKYDVGKTADSSCGPPYLCGGHFCNLQYPKPPRPEDNPAYTQFGDVEYEPVGTVCEYSPGWEWLESQNCISEDKSNLIIGASTVIGSKIIFQDTPCDYSTTGKMCINQEEYFFSTTVKSFTLKNFSSDVFTEAWSGTKYTGAWGIRRAGRDVVICTIFTEKK